MSVPDTPPTHEERKHEAARWIAIVEEDLAVAEAAHRLSPPRRGAAAYHLQQAAEKLMKALLVLAGEVFRRTHDLDDLAARVIAVYPHWTEQLTPLRSLTPWSVAYRYPGLEDEPEPTDAELEQAAAWIGDLARLMSEL